MKCKEAAQHQCCQGVGAKRKEVVNPQSVLKVFYVSGAAKQRKRGESASIPSSHALGSTESSSSSLSRRTPVRRSPCDRGITDTRSTGSPLYRGFRVSDCTSLMNVCCLGILDPLSHQPGITVNLVFCLGPKWLRDIDNSVIFLQ